MARLVDLSPNLDRGGRSHHHQDGIVTAFRDLFAPSSGTILPIKNEPQFSEELLIKFVGSLREAPGRILNHLDRIAHIDNSTYNETGNPVGIGPS